MRVLYAWNWLRGGGSRETLPSNMWDEWRQWALANSHQKTSESVLKRTTRPRMKCCWRVLHFQVTLPTRTLSSAQLRSVTVESSSKNRIGEESHSPPSTESTAHCTNWFLSLSHVADIARLLPINRSIIERYQWSGAVSIESVKRALWEALFHVYFN